MAQPVGQSRLRTSEMIAEETARRMAAHRQSFNEIVEGLIPQFRAMDDDDLRTYITTSFARPVVAHEAALRIAEERGITGLQDYGGTR